MALANFAACLAVTLKWEGAWSNNPKDPGGATMCGITLATYSRWLKRPASMTELRCMPAATRLSLYKQDYWDALGGDDLPKGVDMMLFDIAVNSGDGRAHNWALQTAHMQPITRIHELDDLRRGFWRKLASFGTFGKGWFARENDVLANALHMAGAMT